LLALDAGGKLTTQFSDKWDDFNFSIVIFRCLCSSIPPSPEYGVYTSQLTVTHTINMSFISGNGDTICYWDFYSPFTDSIPQFFYGRYNDLVYQYNLPLSQMLSDVF
jgi:hypothetical protein